MCILEYMVLSRRIRTWFQQGVGCAYKLGTGQNLLKDGPGNQMANVAPNDWPKRDGKVSHTYLERVK